MKSLYLRVWATIIVALALFALVSGWLVQRHMEGERERMDALANERLEAWGDLIERSLPGAEASAESQAQALQEWSQRLRLALALDDAQGRRIASSEMFERRSARLGSEARSVPIHLDDGRTLWLLRGPRQQLDPRFGPPPRGPPRHGADRAGGGGGGGVDAMVPPPFAVFAPPGWPRSSGLVIVMLLLFVAVAAGAYPVVRRLTRRLEALQQGVERFGAGNLQQRVAAEGRDEVAAVAASFNRAAERIEALVRSHQSLLANASHELRSPLARLKMALSLIDGEGDARRRDSLRREIDTDIAELDALVEEVLTASRLDAQAAFESGEVELVGLAAEEAARSGAELDAEVPTMLVRGDERLLRRALRNLLENARRYGGEAVELSLRQGPLAGPGSSSAAPVPMVELRIADRGAGVPADMRERIFEPFFRLPGHAEQQGGVGLGLSLVRQIAERHHGRVRCEPRDGGGSVFVLELPAA